MHYKRKKSRTRFYKPRWDKWKFKKKYGEEAYWNWTGNWPAWWDIQYHTRRWRAMEREVVGAVFRGAIDADEAAWPVHHKPHIYFW